MNLETKKFRIYNYFGHTVLQVTKNGSNSNHIVKQALQEPEAQIFGLKTAATSKIINIIC